jgi:hypothetical protein
MGFTRYPGGDDFTDGEVEEMNAKRWGLLACMLLLFACAKPLPPDKTGYAGAWQGQGMLMLIQADGRFAYKRTTAGVNTSINSPIKEFDSKGFSVGIGPISTHFDVTVPPHQDSGAWKMTVDGVELTRTDDPNVTANLMQNN